MALMFLTSINTDAFIAMMSKQISATKTTATAVTAIAAITSPELASATSSWTCTTTTASGGQYTKHDESVNKDMHVLNWLQLLSQDTQETWQTLTQVQCCRCNMCTL